MVALNRNQAKPLQHRYLIETMTLRPENFGGVSVIEPHLIKSNQVPVQLTMIYTV